MRDAVFNLSHTALVVEALRTAPLIPRIFVMLFP
jgi:hypothetical protein